MGFLPEANEQNSPRGGGGGRLIWQFWEGNKTAFCVATTVGRDSDCAERHDTLFYTQSFPVLHLSRRGNKGLVGWRALQKDGEQGSRGGEGGPAKRRSRWRPHSNAPPAVTHPENAVRDRPFQENQESCSPSPASPSVALPAEAESDAGLAGGCVNTRRQRLGRFSLAEQIQYFILLCRGS